LKTRGSGASNATVFPVANLDDIVVKQAGGEPAEGPGISATPVIVQRLDEKQGGEYLIS